MSIDVILEELEKIHEKLDRILVSRGIDWDAPQSTIHHSPGFEDYVPKKEPVVIEKTIVKGGTTESKEEVEMAQDLAQVLLMNETEKAFLVVKHGFQVWVAKSHLEDSEGYDLGNRYDLKVKEKSKWVLKKLDWQPFTVVKN